MILIPHLEAFSGCLRAFLLLQVYREGFSSDVGVPKRARNDGAVDFEDAVPKGIFDGEEKTYEGLQLLLKCG